jgi:hypothetical protein
MRFQRLIRYRVWTCGAASPPRLKALLIGIRASADRVWSLICQRLGTKKRRRPPGWNPGGQTDLQLCSKVPTACRPGNRAQDVGSIPIARSLFPFNNLLSRSQFRVCIRPPSVIPRDCRPFCILTTDGQNLVFETPMPIFGCWSV